MRYISSELRKLVIRRAENYCEYCHLSQKGQEATFHIDHIIPIASGGETILENLAISLCFLFITQRFKRNGN